MAERWRAAVDFGTANTAVAVDEFEGTARSVDVSASGQGYIFPSAIGLRPDGGWDVGKRAVALYRSRPDAIVLDPKRHLYDGTPLLFPGGVELSAEAAAGLVIGRALAHAKDLYDGTAPAELALTHPAVWGRSARDRLVASARKAGFSGPVRLLPEPVAAALQVVGHDDGPRPDRVGVFDLGAGTFDIAVLARQGSGLDVVVSDGHHDLGGNRFDTLLGGLLRERLNEVAPAIARELAGDERSPRLVADFNTGVREARHHLANDRHARATSVDVEWKGDNALLEMTRPEHDEVLGPEVRRAVDQFIGLLDGAALGPDRLDRLVLSGGASRGLLIEQVLSGRVGRPVVQHPDPKVIVAVGALSFGLLSESGRKVLSLSAGISPDMIRRAVEAGRRIGA